METHLGEQNLFEQHENMESGCWWEASYTRIKLAVGTEVDIFAGLECKCGAFISYDELPSIINHYYGNRIHLGIIKKHIRKLADFVRKI